MTELKIKDREEKGVSVLEIGGVLDIGSLEVLQKKITELIGQGKRNYLIDFHDIDRISSLGLGVLIAICKSVRKVDGCLALCTLSQEVKDVFQITRLIGIFHIFSNQKDAFVGFKEGFEPHVETSIRRYKRVKANIPVDIQIYKSPDKEKHKASTLNLEYEGIFISGSHKYEMDDILEITLHLPDGQVAVLGRVVWVAQKERHPDYFPGIGIHFINVDDDLRKRLDPFLQLLNEG